MLLRSKQLSQIDVTYIATQSTQTVNQVLHFLSSDQKYYNTINQTEHQMRNDETARRRREQRHIYFRNLNARRRGKYC